jgi:hypothetical protein
MNQAQADAIEYVKSSVPGEIPIYFSPFWPDDPNVFFRGADLPTHPVGSFNGYYCMVLRDTQAVYASITQDEPGFQDSLTRWADVRVLARGPRGINGNPEYSLFEATTRPAVLADLNAPPTATFGDTVELRIASPLSATAHPGDSVPLAFAFRVTRPVTYVYSAFIHLYGERPPEAGGPILSQGDSQICGIRTVDAAWQPGETIFQQFTLPISPDLPAGAYRLAVACMRAPRWSGCRLPRRRRRRLATSSSAICRSRQMRARMSANTRPTAAGPRTWLP